MTEVLDSTAAAVDAVRRGVGLWLRDDYTFIRFTGADVATWLQSQTTNDVVALESGAGHANALLDRQGRLQAHFTLHRWEDEYWLIVERAQAERLLQQLDDHLFIEDVQMEETGDEVEQMLVQGPRALAFLADVLQANHVAANEFLPRGWEHIHPVEIFGHEVLAIRHTETGEDGYLLIIETGEGQQLLDKFHAYPFRPAPQLIPPEARETLRIEAGIPRYGIDITDRHLLPETTLERNALSYEKGCYLGQEVIARLKTYGAPKRYLMGLLIQNSSTLQNRGMGVSPMQHGRDAHASNLPHWTRDGATYFVTFRLEGTLPKYVREIKKSSFEVWDKELDTYKDVYWLSKPELAELVENAILHFHGERYWLYAWCVMPNHVHVVVRPYDDYDLVGIVQAWKSFTAHEVNKRLNKEGPFWQSEYYDHLIRDEDDLLRCMRYTFENPEKSGFDDWKFRGFHEEVINDDSVDALVEAHGRDAHATKPSLELKDMKLGSITSACWSPTLGAVIALAYLDRDHRTPGETLELSRDSETCTATVQMLPLYAAPTREDRAQALYDQALDLFQLDSDDADPSTIPLLEEALLLNPEFEDAYEVLGVILHRHGRLAEAVRIMEQLAERNPDCMMAHTNLSVFYLAQGDIERAEEEKAKAAVLQIQTASDERAAHEAAQAERQRIEEEARERIGMFEEVLEIDPDDPVATFGLGKAYIQLNQYADAVPHLRHATEVQKDYSAAYLELGKCHQALNETSAATETFQEGIRVAARKGDLMPLREMERRLKEMNSSLD